MMNLYKFENYINNSNYVYAKKRGLIYMFKKLNLWEVATKRDVSDWDKSFIIKSYRKGVDISNTEKPIGMNMVEFIKLSEGASITSYFGLYTNITYINEILKYLNREDIVLSVQDFQEHIEKKSNLFTKDEIIDICNSLVNVQDKFIIYGLFSGIRGSKYEDLVKLETKNINFDTKEILLPSGKIIIMDEYLEDILKDIVDNEFGSYYYKLNRSGLYDTNSFYRFNMNSPYVLKVKPTVNNGDGLGFMSFQGLQTRLKGISSILDVSITGVNVYRSGVIHKMYEIKKDWVQGDIITFITKITLSYKEEV